MDNKKLKRILRNYSIMKIVAGIGKTASAIKTAAVVAAICLTVLQGVTLIKSVPGS